MQRPQNKPGRQAGKHAPATGLLAFVEVRYCSCCTHNSEDDVVLVEVRGLQGTHATTFLQVEPPRGDSPLRRRDLYAYVRVLALKIGDPALLVPGLCVRQAQIIRCSGVILWRCVRVPIPTRPRICLYWAEKALKGLCVLLEHRRPPHTPQFDGAAET